MAIQRFFVSMKPVGKGRPRFARGRAYTPKNTVEAEKKIVAAYSEKYVPSQTTAPLKVDIKAYDQLPKSKPKSITSEMYTSKPDADNIAKLILDALNSIAFHDDSQVVHLCILKYPRTRSCEQGLDITIEELTAWPDH